MQGASYTTIRAEVRREIDRIKGSRFIATATHATSEADAISFTSRVAKEFHDARHTCWAYRLGRSGDTWRFQDDGEPSGSAGRPILQQIEGQDLTDVVVTVTRYFGGTKLGVGGLVRAYGGAAAAVLETAERAIIVITTRVVVEFPYECSAAVQALLAARQLTPAESEYGTEVRLVFDVPEALAATFEREVRDRTAGLARCTRSIADA